MCTLTATWKLTAGNEFNTNVYKKKTGRRENKIEYSNCRESAASTSLLLLQHTMTLNDCMKAKPVQR